MFLGHFDRRKLRNCPQIYAIVYDFLSDKMSDNMPDKMTAVLKYCKFLKFRLQLVLKLFNAKEICNHKKKVKLVCPAVSGQKKAVAICHNLVNCSTRTSIKDVHKMSALGSAIPRPHQKVQFVAVWTPDFT